jgi:hypothetical protein
MSIAASSISETPVSSQPGPGGAKNLRRFPPGNRRIVAKSDIVTPPEPR